MGHVTTWVGVHQGKLPFPAKSGSHSHSGSRVVILVCHRVSQDRVMKISWFYGWKPLSVSLHPVMFGGHIQW